MTSQDIYRIINDCCDRFEAEVREGNSPAIEAYLNEVDLPHRSQILRELLVLEFELSGPEQFPKSALRYRKEVLPEFNDIIEECVAAQSTGQLHLLSLRHKSEGLVCVDDPFITIAQEDAAEKADQTASQSNSSTKQMGNYKLLQVIGEGGMGSVWMADQEKPVRRRVALKIIRAGLDSREVIARFEAERQALAMMDHPNIARILDAGTTEQGQPYFAMELVKGVPMTEYCDAHRLDLTKRLQLFTKVCDAVQHAHQKGIIHRDLKPSNILVTEYNGQPVPKVIDFGLAKALKATQKLTDKSLFTEFGQVLGTLKYMSPEQAGLDALDIDTRSDIYAMGVILYELLTGTTPLESDSFKGQAILKVLELIREQESPRPSSRLTTTNKDTLAAVTEKRRTDARRLGSVLLGDLDWIVMKALDKDRNRRYESANGFSQDIEHYLNSEPVSARPPSFAYLTTKFIRKNRGLVTAASLIIAAILFGLAGTIWYAIDANQARRIADNEKQVAIDEREASEQVIEFLVASFRSSDPWVKGIDVKVTDVLDNALSNLDQGMLQNNAKAKARLLLALGKSSGALGDHRKALNALQQALQIQQGMQQPDPVKIVEIQSFLAAVFRDLGQHEESLDVLDDVIEAKLQLNGENSREYLGSLKEKALTLRQAGKEDIALELSKSNYVAHRDAFGELDSSTLTAMNNLAVNYFELGRIEDAEPLIQDLVVKRKQVLAENHPDTITAINLLAGLLQEKGDAVGCQELVEQVVALRKKVLGIEHPSTLTAMNNLAIVRAENNDLSGAAELSKEAARVYAKKLGPDHPNSIALSKNAGILAMRSGNPNLAIEMLEPLNEAVEQTFGPNSPQLIDLNGHLAEAIYESGETQLGLQKYRGVVELCTQYEPNGGPLTKIHLSRLMEKLEREWQFDELLPILEPAATAPLSIENLQSKLDLAKAYLRVGQFEDARDSYSEIISAFSERAGLRQLNNQELIVFGSKMNLAEALDQLGEKEQAATLASELADVWRKDPLTGNALAFTKVTLARCDTHLSVEHRLTLLDEAEARITSADNIPPKLSAYYMALIKDGRELLTGP